jgi:hypothetical protein
MAAGRRTTVAVALAAVLLTTSMGVAGAEIDAGADDGIINVPDDEATIQDAVDASKPGDLILVAPGIYREAVTIGERHRNLVIRGESRAQTILDGEFSEAPGTENGFKVFADGVAIENITARNFITNGFFWTGVDGYRGSYLTAIRNGDYGIYAFDSVNGQLDHSYASGSPDAGFYIGQCRPCNALVVDVEAEWNGLGYSGTNASRKLVIARSSFHDNRGGIVPNSLSGEYLAPQGSNTIIGNHVYDNNNPATAAISIAELATGNGILVAGGNGNRVDRNLVTGHTTTGIGVIPLPERLLEPDDPGLENFDARENQVRGNVTEGNLYDLASLTAIDDAADAGDNCFAGNTFTTSEPDGIEQLLPCGEPSSPDYAADLGKFAGILFMEQPPSADYKLVALPERTDLPEMPRARRAPARAATNEPSIRVNLARVQVPAARP